MQRSKEKGKITLYTRGKIIDVLNETIPQLVDCTLKAWDNMRNVTPKDYEASITFGE
ncbi:MAG: hypothetical protein GX992_07745 [Clostridium sp.]|nr:hypothetical protein [Clostridium sp.]